MKKTLKILMLAFPVILMLNCICFAEDLTKTMDKFYAGVADIIERNMDNPKQCVREVDNYYAKNQATIAQIRKETKKAMEQVAPAMAEFKLMIEENAEVAEGLKDTQQRARNRAATQTPGAERYAKAMQSFTMKHLQYGLKIATKAMQLVPDFGIMKQTDE